MRVNPWSALVFLAALLALQCTRDEPRVLYGPVTPGEPELTVPASEDQ